MDETDVITRYFAPLAAAGALELTDDLASLSAGPDILVTSDSIMEGKHYLANDPPSSVAKKLLRVNLSDLAAKGGRPLGYILNASFNSRISENWIAEFALGLQEDQQIFDVKLLGGDTITHDGPQIFSVTMLGQAAHYVPRRKDARPDDIIVVTGIIGRAVLGLGLLKGEISAEALSSKKRDEFIHHYHKPEPRLRLGQRLIAADCIHAAMDISDGLILDLNRLLQASHCAAKVRIDHIPVCSGFPDWLERMITGGDDYELLLTIPPAQIEEAIKIAADCDVPLRIIGEILPGEGLSLIDAKQLPVKISKTGYKHMFG